MIFSQGKNSQVEKKNMFHSLEKEDYPVFAHAGSIIPLSNRSDRNNIGLATEMEIHIFPRGK